MRRIVSFLGEDRGSSSVEFVLVLTPFLILFFAIFHVALLMYSSNRLNFATEATARCLVVSANSAYSGAECSDTAKAQAYFAALYQAPAPAPAPTVTDETCGKRVVATATYTINALLASKAVSLSANACFPKT